MLFMLLSSIGAVEFQISARFGGYHDGRLFDA